jgi:hypothetical protein
MKLRSRLYTKAEDTLDGDDPIFPRAATRVGMKYQASVLSWEEQQEAEARHRSGENEAGPSRHIPGGSGQPLGIASDDQSKEGMTTGSESTNPH